MGELQIWLTLAQVSCTLLQVRFLFSLPATLQNHLQMKKQVQRSWRLQITKLTSNRAGEEGASEGEGKRSKGKATTNPGACRGPGLGLKARPMGWGLERRLSSFPGCSGWDLFCLGLSWWGRRQRLWIWREGPGSPNSEGPREEWGGLLSWWWWRCVQVDSLCAGLV